MSGDLPRPGCVYFSRYSKRGPEPGRCCIDVGQSYSNVQCSRPVKVERDTVDWNGKRARYGYCGIHDPVKLAERKEARLATARAKFAAQNAAYAKEARLRKLKDAALDALRLIADGHSNPRELAQSVLSQGDEASALRSVAARIEP